MSCAANHCAGGLSCHLTTNRCVLPLPGCQHAPPPQPVDAGVPPGGGGAGGGSGGAGGGPQGVGPSGGVVSRLHFAVTGDTRPANCEDTAGYPTAIITGIAQAIKAKGAQFVVDEGDHMNVCNNSLAIATQQMTIFTQSVAHFDHTWFMTMGNHECRNGPCLSGNSNANYVAFMSALAPISPRPYYDFHVQTDQGRATFVVIADNAWDGAQQTWLEQTLSDADLHSTYTLIFRHHPEGDTSVSTNATSMSIIRQHKFALFISGHAHTYKHMTTDGGRDMVIGLGGAPLLAAGASWNGYAIIDQLASGQLQVTLYDVSGGTVRDTWQVGPNL